MSRTARTALALIAATAGLTAGSTLHAAAFTAGNVVVSRIAGNASTAAAIFLDEYTPAGGLVQSIPLPTTASGGNFAITQSGSANSNGALTRSTDGHYLVIGGYDVAVGTASVTSNTGHVVARIAADGSVDTSTKFTDAGNDNFRSVATVDGSSYYVAGNANSTAAGSPGGVRLISHGTTTGTRIVGGTSALNNARVVNIFNNQLYVSSQATGFIGVNSAGTGLPNAQTTATVLPGTGIVSASPYDFVLADANTLYVADDRTSGAGGLEKFTLSGGTWSLAYSSLSGSAGLRGLTLSGSTLYGITTDNKLVSATDTGSGFTFSTLATAAAGSNFRGVDLAPTPAPTLAASLTSTLPAGTSLGTATVNGSSASGFDLANVPVSASQGFITIAGDLPATTGETVLVYLDFANNADAGTFATAFGSGTTGSFNFGTGITYDLKLTYTAATTGTSPLYFNFNTNGAILNNIAVVPEPTTLTALFVPAGMLLARRRRQA